MKLTDIKLTRIFQIRVNFMSCYFHLLRKWRYTCRPSDGFKKSYSGGNRKQTGFFYFALLTRKKSLLFGWVLFIQDVLHFHRNLSRVWIYILFKSLSLNTTSYYFGKDIAIFLSGKTNINVIFVEIVDKRQRNKNEV